MKTRTPHPESETSFVFGVADLQELLAPRSGPFVSIYFPSHRRKTEARSDSIVYRNLCREVEKILASDGDSVATRDITARLRALDEPGFWERGSEGVAVFAAPDFFRAYRLPMVCPQLEVVGGSFHTKPLIRYLNGGLSYRVLCISPAEVRLFDAWGETLQELPLGTVPSRLEDVLDRERPVRARGDLEPNEDLASADNERFHRELARALSKHPALRDGRTPIVLVAAMPHQQLFRRVANLPALVETGVPHDASKLSREALAAQAREVMLPELERRVEKACEDFLHAKSKSLGSHRLVEVAKAAAQGRVRQLCVESGCRYWGLLDRQTGSILPGDEHKNAYDVDIYDELAELVVGQGGEVLVLPKEQMPVKSGIAAIFRY